METTQLLRFLNIDEEILKQKSEFEIIDLISENARRAKTSLSAEYDKKILDNFRTKVPELKDFFASPFQIFVNGIMQKKSLTPVKIVGYVPDTQQLIAYHSGKICLVPEDKIIGNEDELQEAKLQKKMARVQS